MSLQEIRQILIAKTISVIANDGLDKTTTKAITRGTGINEAYIYRCFAHKEDLLAKMFAALDEELVSQVNRNLPIMYCSEMEYEVRCRAFFVKIWRFLLGNEEKCLAFIRYYYSPYFAKNSETEHKNRFVPLVQKFSEAFLEEANVWMLLNYILNVMLDFAVKVFSGAVGDNEDTEEHVFRLIYHSVSSYFK